MRIETDKYLITSGNDDFVVQMKSTTKDSQLLKDKSKIGGVKLSEKTYHPSLEMAYKRIAKSVILESEAKDLDDVKMLLRELIDEVRFMQ
jgi:hypothetical protein